MGLVDWVEEKLEDTADFAVGWNPITIATDIVTGGEASEALGLEHSAYQEGKKLLDPEIPDTGKTIEEAAAAGIRSLEEQQAIVEELYKPFYDVATEEALPQLQQMIMGGDVDYTPSKLYDLQKEQGTRNIKRIQASKGLLGSTGTETKLSSFYSDLAAEEAERAYGGRLSQIQLGSRSAEAVQAASGSMAGNVGSLYANLGRQQQAAAVQAGASRQALYQGLSNTLQNYAMYSAMGG